MGTLAENSLWYKGKSEVLREFKKTTGAILSAVASRNFSAMPGFAIEAFTDVEIDSKIRLTEHNQKIMSDAIDRELKALGLENDIAVKQAMMAWEIEKVQLFSELQKEFADKEALRSLRGEEIDGLMIDQEIREIGVLLAKTAIEVEIEGIKREKEALELLPLPYEEQLAAAKLAAAQRKQSAIPYILATLAAQSAALDAEETVIFPAREEKALADKEVADRTVSDVLPLMVDKSAATQALTGKQTELLSPLIEKANASMALADEMLAQLGNHRLIAEEKVKLANEKITRLTKELALQGKELTLEGKKITIEIDRAGLELQRAAAKLEIVDALRVQLGEIKTAMIAEAAAEIVYINTQGANEVAVKKSKIDNVDTKNYDAKVKELGNQTSAVNALGEAEKAHHIAMANNTKSAKITQKLFHLIG
jgi:hypothetical protein